MFAICFFGYGIGKKLQTPAGENGQYTYVQLIEILRIVHMGV